MAIVGTHPGQYLGRAPGPLYIEIATTVGGIWIGPRANRDGAIPPQAHHHKNIPREAVLPLYYLSSAPEEIHHTTHWIRVLHHNGGLNQYKPCVPCVVHRVA